MGRWRRRRRRSRLYGSGKHVKKVACLQEREPRDVTILISDQQMLEVTGQLLE